MRASLVEACEIDAHVLLLTLLGDDDRVHQPFQMTYLPNDIGFLQLAGLLDDEGLLLSGLSPRLLLYGACVGAHHQVMLTHTVRNADQVLGLPREHIFVRAEEAD